MKVKEIMEMNLFHEFQVKKLKLTQHWREKLFQEVLSKAA